MSGPRQHGTRVTERLSPDVSGIARAAALLAQGRTVAFPTETVYGLGADAGDAAAIAAIYAAKDRPAFNPLIVHCTSIAQAEGVARFDDAARRLAAAFWPGPLTLVLPLRPGAPVADLALAGLPTLALRVPAHPLARALLAAFGGLVAAPSANPSGRISPTTADHVLDGLAGRIDAVLDGGACPVGVESTIIGWPAGIASLLRPGGLPVEAVEAALGIRLARPGTAAHGSDITAPGQLASHYAPAAPLRLNADAPGPCEAWLGFGPRDGRPGLTLSETGDLHEAAANLFGHLRMLDARVRAEGLTGIAAAPVPQHGLGLAINDRLARAAAPRPGIGTAGDDIPSEKGS
jgi:L-threonylcarbamoyladenylate synthase